MNPKSYSVLIGPTEAQEKDGLASSDMHVFSNYKSAMTYLNEEVKRRQNIITIEQERLKQTL